MSGLGMYLKLELHSDPRILCVIRSAVMRLTEEMGFPASECWALTRAVDEALANIIRHAYHGQPGKPIELLCRHVEQRTRTGRQAALEIVMMDRGARTNRKKLSGRSLDDIRPGGLGLHFIRSGVDMMQYSYRAHKNRLRLLKYLPSAQSKPQSTKGE